MTFRWLLALALVTGWWWGGACAVTEGLARTTAFAAWSSGSEPVDDADAPDHGEVTRGVDAAPVDSARMEWEPAALGGGSLELADRRSASVRPPACAVSRRPPSRRSVPERARAPPPLRSV